MLSIIYLQDNPLIKEPLKPEEIKNRLLGHWGVSLGLAFIYIHMMRLIKKYGLDMIFLAGRAWRPRACIWREAIRRFIRTEDQDGLREFFEPFSFSGRHGQPLHP